MASSTLRLGRWSGLAAVLVTLAGVLSVGAGGYAAAAPVVTTSGLSGPSASARQVLADHHSPPPSTVPASAASLRKAAPGTVAVAMLKTLWTVNAAKDKTPFAAEVRATAYMTPIYAADIRDHPPQAAPGAQWQSWVDHHVVTTVKVVLEHDSGAPVDTATTTYLQYLVTVTPHGAHGWKGANNVYVEFVEMTRAGSRTPWLVAAVETSV